MNTPERKSGLEGASPFILNADITYISIKNNKCLATSLVFNYFSDRIYSIGTLGYNDTIEKGIPFLDFVASYQFNKRLYLKFKVANLLNPAFNLVRKSSISNEHIVLNQFRKGSGVNLGLSYNL